MTSERVFRSLAKRWLGGSARRRPGGTLRTRPSRLRRFAKLLVEELEDRTLLSVLPAPLTTGQTDISLAAAPQGGNENTPSIAYDPADPRKMVAVWSSDWCAGQLSEIEMAFSTDGGKSWSPYTGPTTLPNVTCNPPPPIPTNPIGPDLIDPALDPLDFTYAINPSVAFDRSHFFYVTYEDSGTPTPTKTSGAVVLKKYDFTGGSPSPITFPTGITTNILYEWAGDDPAFNPTLAVDNNLPNTQTDPANPLGPKVGFVDPQTGATQTDPVANSIINPGTGLPDPTHDQLYVSWNLNDTPPTGATIPPFNPDVVRLTASSDGGNDWTTQKHLNNGINFGTDHDANPVLTVSSGTSSDRASTPTLGVKSMTASGTTVTVVTTDPIPFWLVNGSEVVIAGANPTLYDGTYVISIDRSIPNTFSYQLTQPTTTPATGTVTVRPVVNPGGQVTAVYNDFANNQLVTNRVVDGGTAADFTGPLNGQCGGGVICPATSAGPTTTRFTLDLTNVVPPTGFTTISDLYITLSIVSANLGNLTVWVTPPDGQTNFLLAPTLASNAAGLGYVCNGIFCEDVPTVFDDNAARSILDPNAKAPYASHYQPVVDPFFPSFPLNSFDGKTLTSSLIAGVWTLNVLNTSTTAYFVNEWHVDFTSRLTPQTNTVAVRSDSPGGLLGGAFSDTFPDKLPAAPNVGVGPSPSLAVDDTLGSFSPYQGRLYLTYTGGSGTNTDVFMVSSDTAGLSWSAPVKLNDDSAADGFSEGNRAQFQSRVAVDPVTGTVVAAWYDARYDASNARVATFMATSIDGGQTFSTNTYLNASRQALDDASFDPTTGGHQVVTLEPIPDNQSAGNPNADKGFNFGPRQGLVVYDGHVHAVWSGNEDGGPRLTSLDAAGRLVSTDNLDILTSDTVIGIGPRITASTMGPVDQKQVTTDDGRTITFNDTYAPESSPVAGSQQVNGFVVTFDRPVDPSTFTPNEVSVLFRDTQTQANNTPPYYGGTPVDPTSYRVLPLDGYTTRYGPAQVGGVNPLTGLPLLSTQFLVTFAPESSTGTISYAVGPDIRDRVRNPDVPIVLGSPVSPPPPLSSDTPIDIPPDASQGDTGGPDSPHTLSTITLGGYDPKLQISHLDVKVRINHTSDSDLVIKLIGPDGVTNAVLAQNTGNGQNFGTTAPDGTVTYTIFDDLSSQSINLGTPPFLGTFKPQTALSVFNGFAINGKWTLDIQDTVSGDTGQLLSWTMDMQAGFPTTTTALGNLMDQNADAVTVANIVPPGAADPKDVYADPRPLGGIPFQLPYDPLTLPLSVPGPHMIGSFVPGVDAQGKPINPPTADNEVLNGTVGAIDVVFDRDMNPASFTPAQLLRLVGPVGSIDLFDSSGNPLPGVYVKPDPNPGYPRLIDGQLTTAADPDPLHPRTFQIGLPTRAGAPAGTVGQDLSGTYNLTLGSAIAGKDGEQLDTNLNAGFAVLNGNDPTSTNLVPGGVSHDTGPIAVQVKPGATVFTPLSFAEAFQIQHTALLLNITSPNSQDLAGFLVAPNGAKIELFTGPGGTPRPAQQTGFINTTLDDRGAAPIQPDSNGLGPSQPFRGTFSPQQPLSTLNGLSSGGTWQLEIVNSSTDPTHTATITEWRLTFDETQLGTGLGEPVADQATVHFRIFTMDPSNPLSHQVWTPIGPASINGNGNSGRIGGLAVDPSDPSGNTVYVAGASGGVWKTTNFLTTDPNGPTYVPLTDFGPTFAINIGGLAVFGQNDDPRQSVVFAATGEGDTGSTGVGFLRSEDGGATWQLLDSAINVDAQGNPLPLSQRTHDFVGTTAFKVVVDPIRSPSGQVVVYAALSGANGGIWRSTDSGNTWVNVLPGQATDVTLSAYSAFDANNPAAPPGNAQVVFGALAGQGVFVSANQGSLGSWTLMDGQQGGDPLLRLANGQGLSAAIGALPNGANGRIVLAAPALTGQLVPGQPYTGNRAQDLIYENWLYAVVITGGSGGRQGGGVLNGLYVTKDRGRNWTKIPLHYAGNENAQPPVVIPTDDETKAQFEPFAAGNFPNGQGNYDVSLTIDPNNPSVVYLGGTADGPPFPFTRVDTTGLFDPYAVVPYDDSNNDGGTMQGLQQTMAAHIDGNAPNFDGLKIPGAANPVPYLNALRDPNNVFLNNATRIAVGVQPAGGGPTASFVNNGENIAKWGPWNGAGGTDYHRVIALRDPLTGKTRLILGDDQGVWTAIDPGDGSVLGALGSITARAQAAGAPAADVSDGGVGLTSGPVAGDRNGNLQITQFYYGAVQPSVLAGEIGQALFYANAQDNGFPVSDPHLLTDGNLTWNGPEGDGSGIAADQTGTGSVYTYQWPCCGTHTQTTDFFSVNPQGAFDPTGGLFPSRTTGLVERNLGGIVPDPQWPYLANNYGSDVVSSSVNVNPTNADDLLISSVQGRVFRSGDQGVNWTAVAFPPGDFLGRNTPSNTLDGTYAPALAFGPVDPLDPSARPDLDTMWAGTVGGLGNQGGHAYVTLDGGGHWTNISAGLDGSPVLRISPDPKPGSHDAYAVTLNGVYHTSFNVTWSPTGVPSINGPVTWTPITGNLDSLAHEILNTPGTSSTYLKDVAGNPTSAEGGGLTALAVDWRYVIPDDPNNPNGSAHPALYVGGEAGVFRSLDNGATWTIFPDVKDDGAPADGGYLPVAHVTDLQLSTGNINPGSGLPDQPTGPNLLYATTFGRGTFAIRLPLSSPFNKVLGPQITSAVATNSANGALPNPVNQTVGLDTVSLVFGGTIDPSTFTIGDLGLTGPKAQSVSRSGTTVTFTMAGPHGLKPGDRVLIAGAAQAAYDGLFTVTGVGPTTFTVTVPGNPPQPTGTITVLRALEAGVTSITSSGTTATVTTAGTSGYNVGDRVVIAGASPAGYDGTFTVTGVLAPNEFTYTVVPGLASPATTGTAITADELPIRQLVDLSGANSTFGVTSLKRVGTTATVTTAGANGFVSGDQVTISGATNALYNGTFTILVTGPNTFTYTVPSSLPATDNGTITATKVSGPSAHNLWQVSLVHQLGYGDYNLTVGPNITDYAGHPMDQDGDDNGGGGNPDDVFTKTFTVAGLQVLGVVTPPSPVATPPGLSSVVVNFNAVVNPASFTTGSVTVVGPKGPVQVASVQDVSGNPAIAALLPAGVADHAWQINLQSAQLVPGTYTVSVGPNITDTGDGQGNNLQKMDQNGNGVYGEAGVSPAGDTFQATFTIQGLRVVSVDPSLALRHSPVLEPPGLSSATVTFSREVNPLSFDPSKLTFTGPAGSAIPVTLKDLAPAPGINNVWEVDFAAQTTPGIYTMVIGPNVTDSTGTPMDQNQNLVFGENPGDQYTALFDVDGLAVTSVSPSGPIAVPIGQKSVTVTFNQGALGSTMTAANLTLTGPGGVAVPLTNITDLTGANGSHKVWELDFAAQNSYGTYTLTVNSGVEDLAGNGMNQNHNLTFGEPGIAPAGDGYQTTFTVAGLQVASVTPAPTGPVLEPPGLTALTLTFNMAVDPTSFTPSQVQLTGPDGAAIPFLLQDVTTGTPNLHNVWKITPTDNFGNPLPRVTPGVYTLVVGPGIKDVNGNVMDQGENGTHTAFVARFDVDGLAVTSVSPANAAVLNPGQSSVTVTLNQAVLAASMTAANVTLTNSQGPVTLTGFKDLLPAHNQWEIDFAPQTVPGKYTLTVGPNVEDLAGNAMNQSHGTTFGGAGNAFTSTFAIHGLSVVSVSPDPSPGGRPQPILEPPGFGTVTVTFSREVNPATLGISTVVLTGPVGRIPLSFQDVTPAAATYPHSVWQLNFTPQTAAGIYTLVVGPNVTDQDPTGAPMDQNQNLVFGEPGPAPAGDAYVARYDIDGLAVTSVSPSGPVPVPSGQSSVTVTFNQAVLASTLTPANVTLSGPTGANVPITGFTDLTAGKTNTHTVWEVDFAAEFGYGTYTLTVGPNVQDLAGNAMNQNHNLTFGDPGVAPAGDAYRTTFAIDGLQVTSVTPTFGTLVPDTPGLSSATVTFNMPVDPTSFAFNPPLVTAPDGSPVLGVNLTDLTTATTNLHNVWAVTFPAQTKAGVYSMLIGPNVKDAAGHLMDQNENGTFGETGVAPAGDQYQALFDVDGLVVTSATPSGATLLLPGVGAVTVSFNQAVLAASMTAANVTLTNSQGPVPLTGFKDLLPTHDRWEVDFAGQTIPGKYTLTVGPDLTDLAGNLMDQNRDGTPGEPGVAPTGDAYQTTFLIDGLRVVSVTPTVTTPVLEPPGLSSATVTFNRDVNPATFDVTKLTLTAPGGTVLPVQQVKDLTPVPSSGPNPHNIWEVDFAAQTTPGIYSLTVGPNISDQDPTGAQMDQNQNQVYGEPGAAPNGDAYVARFDVDGLAVTSASPSGAVPVPSGQSSVTVTFNQAVLGSTMTAANLTLTGPGGGTVPLTNITDLTGANGSHTRWELDFAPQTTYGTYTLTVGPNVGDLAGNAMNQSHGTTFGGAGNAFTSTFAIAGLQVTSVTPTSAAPVPDAPGLASATVTFNMPVDPTSFAANPPVLTAPDGTTVGVTLTDITTGTANPHSKWEVDFPALTKAGVYSLVVGPNVKDAAGHAMDQNENGTFGQPGPAPAGDQYLAVFDVDGLAVQSVTPSGVSPILPGSSGVGAVTVSFNQGVLASSLNAADVTLNNPLGKGVALTGFKDLMPAHNVWEVDFAGQTIPGRYTLTVSPNVRDLAGNAMNQNHNSTFGDPGIAPAGDGYQTSFLIDGLRVVSVTPTLDHPVVAAGGLSSVTITFNRPVDPATFDVSQVQLKRYDGAPITTSAPIDISGRFLSATPSTVWEVDFPAQTTPGVYTLVVGPHIADQDPTSAQMDQNQNQVYGEVPGDEFTGQFDVGGLQVVSVTPAAGSAAPAGVSAVVITFNQGVLRGSLATNTVSLVGPGGVAVPLIAFRDVSAGIPNLHNKWEVDFNPLNNYGTYTLTVGPGVQDLAGNPMNQNGDAVFGEPGPAPAGDAFSSTFRVDGLRVVSATPAGPVTTLSSIVLGFNMGVNPSTFQTNDVILTGPDGSNIPVTLTDLSAGSAGPQTQWELDFAPQTATGSYSLTVLPNLLDSAGHQMDQNANGVYGEVPGDEFTDTFVVGQPSTPPPSGGGGSTGGATPSSSPITGLDISGLVQILATRIRRLKNGRYRMTVKVFNTSNQKIQGPFALIVDGLLRKVHLLTATGFTGPTHGPAGHPYEMLVFTANELDSLQGGTFTLTFANPLGRKIRPSFRLLAGIPNP